MYEVGIARRAVKRIQRLTTLRQAFERLSAEETEWMVEDMTRHPTIYDAAMTAIVRHIPTQLEIWQMIRDRLATGQPPFPETDYHEWSFNPAVFETFYFSLLEFADTRTPPEMRYACDTALRAYVDAGGTGDCWTASQQRKGVSRHAKR